MRKAILAISFLIILDDLIAQDALGVIIDEDLAFGLMYMQYNEKRLWGGKIKANVPLFKRSADEDLTTSDGRLVEVEDPLSNVDPNALSPTGTSEVQRFSIGIFYGKWYGRFGPFLGTNLAIYKKIIEFGSFQRGFREIIYVEKEDELVPLGAEVDLGTFFRINSYFMVNGTFSLTDFRIPSLQAGISYIISGRRQHNYRKFKLKK